MSDRDQKPMTDFDDLEPLPVDAELAEMPDELEELDELEPLAELKPLADLPTEVEAEPDAAAKAAAQAKKDADAKRAAAEKAAAEKAAAEKAAAEKAKAEKAKAKAEAEKATAEKAAAEQAAVEQAAAVKDKAAAAEAPPVPAVPTGTPASASDARSSSRSSSKREPRQPKPKANAWERWAGPGEKPKREMEAAPALLRKAATGLFIGCLLPWGGITETTVWGGNVVEKLLVLAALYIWHQTNMLRDGVKVAGFIEKLGKKNFTGLFALAGILALAGFAPILSLASFDDPDLLLENLGPFAEKGFLILAGLTLTHIMSYEHGGRFNPMFPLMFLAPGIAGVMALLKIFSVESIGVGQILGGLGAIAVGGAGWMAAYTMWTAIKEAKVHGEAKKLAQAEARKEARKTRK